MVIGIDVRAHSCSNEVCSDVRRLVRPFPFPYRAALAISPDCDGLTAERRIMLRQFINTTESTPFGRGLGLDVSGSIFLYSRNPRAEPQSSLMDGPDRDLLIEEHRRGWIDSLHSLGDFSNIGGATRQMARRAFDELDRLGMRFRLWVNHGDSFNRQNLATGEGDVPDSPTYLSDIAVEHGIRFAWLSRLTHVIGQDRPCGRREFYLRAPHSFWRRAGALLADFAGQRAVRKLRVEPYDGNRQLWPHTLRDGRRIYEFQRHGFWRFDTIRDLPTLLAPRVLDRLIESGGALILYSHFGESKEETPEQLQHGLDALRTLAERGRRGEIWVQKTSSLLEYLARRDSLRATLARKEGRTVIDIQAFDDPVFGRTIPTSAELRGLTFWVDAPLTTIVQIAGLGPLHLEINPPDLSARPSVTVKS